MSEPRSQRTTPILRGGAPAVAPSATRGATPADDLLGTQLANRYRLDEVVGRGGMGVVYRGRDTRLERDVAVKVLPDMSSDPASRERLLREARAAAALNHPHVVAVYDAGEDRDAPFVVMELVEGRSLRHVMPAEWTSIVATALQICDALDHAHVRGLVHRDLKPENVLGATTGTVSATWKLADLGLAVFRGGTRITREGNIAGTVAYMAPEQALGRDVDGRTDLYALGVMLYEMVTRRLPFEGESPLSVLSQHIHAPVVPPRAHRPEVPRDLEAIIVRLLAKEKERRFHTAKETADALRAASLERVSTSTAAATDAVSETSAAVALLEELARGRLVGRQTALTELRDLWRRASDGHGHLVLLSGEPGAGKTRLARELLVYAQLEGAVVLSSGCFEYEAATPYMPFVEALRRWVRLQTDDDLRKALADTAPELARLAPEIESRLGPFPPRPPLAPHEERLLLFDHLARLLRELAGRRGLVFYVDDLHWADQGTVALLNYLLRQLREDRVLFAASYREIELDRARPLANALLDWNRERLSTRITLERFDLSETGALLGTLLGEEKISAEFVQAVHRETEGNPFFVEEVLKALIEQGQVFRSAGKWDRCEIVDLEVPQSVKSAIGKRLDRIDDAHLDTLRMAAVIGKQFDFAELAAASGGSTEDAILDALDAATAAQLLAPGDGESFAFTHDKIREVLYEELNPIRRRRLHARAAAGLEQLREQGNAVAVEDLAHHCIEAGNHEKGYTYAMAAAGEAERLLAFHEALALYHRARECAEGLDLPGAVVDVEESIGNTYMKIGERVASSAHYENALALVTDPVQRTRLKRAAAAAWIFRGDPRALRYADEALAELDPVKNPIEVADAMTTKARFFHLHGRHRDAAALLEQALALAETSGPPVATVMILCYLAGAYQHLAEHPTSDAWARRAIDLGERTNLLVAIAGGLEFLAENRSFTGPFEEGIEFAQRECEIARKLHSREREGWPLMAEGTCHYALGDLDAAEAAETRALELADQVGEVRLAVLCLVELVVIAAERGKMDEAFSLAEDCLKRAEVLGLLHLRCEARRAMAHARVRGGEPAKAVPLLEQSEKLLEGTDAMWARMNMGPLFVEALLDCGRVGEARARLARFFEMLKGRKAPFLEAWARRLEGRVASA